VYPATVVSLVEEYAVTPVIGSIIGNILADHVDLGFSGPKQVETIPTFINHRVLAGKLLRGDIKVVGDSFKLIWRRYAWLCKAAETAALTVLSTSIFCSCGVLVILAGQIFGSLCPESVNVDALRYI
jgi:hypothetical protein